MSFMLEEVQDGHQQLCDTLQGSELPRSCKQSQQQTARSFRSCKQPTAAVQSVLRHIGYISGPLLQQLDVFGYRIAQFKDERSLLQLHNTGLQETIADLRSDLPESHRRQWQLREQVWKLKFHAQRCQAQLLQAQSAATEAAEAAEAAARNRRNLHWQHILQVEKEIEEGQQQLYRLEHSVESQKEAAAAAAAYQARAHAEIMHRKKYALMMLQQMQAIDETIESCKKFCTQVC